MNAARLHVLRRRLSCTVPFLEGWLQRRAVRELLADGSAAAVRALLEVLPRPDVPDLKGHVLAGLRALSAAEGRSFVCQEWVDRGDPVLAELLRAWGWVPPAPSRLRVLCALKLGRLDELAAAGPEEVRHLVEACSGAEPEVAARAPLALRGLCAAAAREEVCRIAVEQDNRAALAAALEAGYLPEDAGRRALFLFLTGRRAEYDALDFDRRLLAGAYRAACPSVRRRVAERVRRSGRADLLPALSGGAARRRPLSEREWQVTLDLLARSPDNGSLWELAQAAPPRCAARALRLLRARLWCPAVARERDDFRALAELAEGLTEVDCGRFPRWAEEKEGDQRPFAADQRAVLHGHEGGVRGLAVSPDGRLLASAGGDGRVCLWDLEEARLLHTFHAGSPAGCALFGPAGEEIVSSHNGRGHVWPVAGGPAALTFPLGPRGAWCLAVSPDGTLLACDDWDGARVWGLADGRPVAACRVGQYHQPRALAISPDGTVLAAVSGWGSLRLTLWELPGGRLRASAALPSYPEGVAFRGDGRWLATTGGGKLRLWDAAEAWPLGEVPGHRHWATWPDFEPDAPGRAARSGGEERVRLGRLPDGRLLGARRTRRSVHLWVSDGKGTKDRWTIHAEGPLLLAAAPSQGLLAGGALDGTIWLWALPFREEVLAQLPVADMTLTHWDWVRRRLGDEGTPAAERRGLAFLDALLRRRWRHEVHVEEARPALPLEHDIYIEG
jgi:WD40 repeat protein